MAATRTTPEQAKESFLKAIKDGASVEDACKAATRSRKWYENVRSQDRQFAADVDAARERRTRAAVDGKDPALYDLTFAEWRLKFLGRETYPHMQNLVDVLEGRDPSWLHPAMTWEPASRDRVVMNIPVYHAKSQTITVDWVTYKLCLNPNLQILIVSKKQEQAKKFLYQIKQRFSSNLYTELQMAYAGPDGFKGDVWSSNMIYLKGRDSDEKDPNIEAVGLGGQIYGSRADIIILDDCIIGSNANQYENQITWIESEVENRVFDGVIAFVGTRLAPQDLYSEIIRGERYMSGKSPWTYLAMPMVLEFAEKAEDWVTLWPKSHAPMDRNADTLPDADGMYAAWDGPRASHTRSSKPPRTFELVYQQRGMTEDMPFHPTCVWGSVDKRRQPGVLRPGEIGGRRTGMEGLHVILSIDPAGTGEAFMMVYAVDRQTRDRWILQAWMGNNTLPSWYFKMIEQIIPEFGVNDLVIERQGYSNWLYQDEKIVDFCRQRGVRIIPSYTGHGNKVDPDFGVASLAPLLGGLIRRENAGNMDHDGKNIVHIPNPDKSPGIRAFVDQLMTWEPGKSGSKLRQDGPMTWWFAEKHARTILFGTTDTGGNVNQFVKTNRFLSTRARERRSVRPSFFTH